MYGPTPAWTLTKLWRDGLSASQIAAKLGGVSRSAVIGKVHRLGLTRCSRAAPSAPAAPASQGEKTAKTTKAPRPVVAGAALREVPYLAPAPPAPAPLPLPGARAKPWLEREEGECAFPVSGEGADIHSCCAAVHGDSAYCPAHLRRMYVPRPPSAQQAEEKLFASYAKRFAA